MEKHPSTAIHDTPTHKLFQRTNKEKLAEFIGLMGESGDGLAERFRNTPGFSHDFANEYYPLLNRIVRDNPNYSLKDYVNEPGIWNFLDRKQREALLRRIGPMAIVLLEGNAFSSGYPPELQQKIEDFILEGDNNVISSLLTFRNHSLFQKLLNRDIPISILRSAAAEIGDLPSHRAEDRLSYWAGLSDSALTDELGPPPDGPITWVPFYDTLRVPYKWYHGREIGNLEIVFAIADPALLVVDLMTGGGGQIFKTGLKGAVKAAAGEAGEQVIKSTVRSTGREVAQHSVETVIRRVAGEMTEWATKKYSVDITDLVRGIYGNSGIGRSAFKKLTGLEARLFMRGDARVMVLPVALLTGSATMDTAVGLGFGSMLDTETGKNMVGAAITEFMEAKGTAKENMEKWQKHASAWWLMNAVPPPPEMTSER